LIFRNEQFLDDLSERSKGHFESLGLKDLLEAVGLFDSNQALANTKDDIVLTSSFPSYSRI